VEQGLSSFQTETAKRTEKVSIELLLDEILSPSLFWCNKMNSTTLAEVE
jgi:hypothetical protein